MTSAPPTTVHRGSLAEWDPPEVSVIVCTRDRADSLRRTLESLSALECAGCSWEVIVVNNGSRDHTVDVLTTFHEHLPLRWVDATPAGANIARNAGIRASKGSLLVFTDDDITMPQDWLRSYVQAARQHPDRLVFAGPINALLPLSAPSWLLETRFAPQAFGHLVLPEGLREFNSPPFGGNFGCRRTALALATFDESIGPDGTTNYRMGSETSFLGPLHRMGYRALNVGVAVTHYVTDEMVSPAYLEGRARRYAAGQVRGHQADADDIRTWFGIPRWLFRQSINRRIRYWLIRLSGTARAVADARWDRDVVDGQCAAWREKDGS